MRLKELLKNLKSYKIKGSEEAEIFDIQYDSRNVGNGSVFVAIKGEKTDGNRFVPNVISMGAAAVVTDSPSPYLLSLMERGGLRVAIIQVPNAREALARTSAAFYGGPASKLKLVGITGTNGKTTTSFLVESVLREAGLNPGVIGTINYRYAGKVLPAPNTTPESLDLQRLLRDMVDSGVKAVVMEVSSHALSQDRVSGLTFDAGVFTNLTQDHLDYHGTMEAYFDAKARLFTDFIEEGKAAVINMDDSKGEELSKRAAGRVIGYSGMGKGGVNIYPEDVTLGVDGIRGTFATPSGKVKIKSSLIGEFNLYNILAAVGAGVGLGLSVEVIERGITALKSVPGRLEIVDAGQPFTILVDYAHTPDALERVLSTIRDLTGKRIITVFGCGGDRDSGKRPIMGRIAAEYSNVVIVTSDNPRTEDPLKIIEDITGGIRKEAMSIEVIPGRREAIGKAISLAEKGDVVLLAGKGHEDYQIIGEEKIHFDDREEARKAVQAV